MSLPFSKLCPLALYQVDMRNKSCGSGKHSIWVVRLQAPDAFFNLVDDLDSFQVKCIQKISVCIWFGAEQVCQFSAKCFSLHPSRAQRLCGDISASQPAHGDRLCIYASLLEEHEFHTEAVHSGVAD